MTDYEKFFQDVRTSVKERLSAYDLTDQELDDYLKREEQQIKGEYEDLYGPESEDMTKEAAYKSAVEAAAMCLEYCY